MSEMLTAKQVMARLKLGRTTVYGLGRRFLETAGAEGLPCRKIGRSLRFPADEVDAWMATGPVIRPGAAGPVPSRPTTASAPQPTPEPTTSASAEPRDALDDEIVEPFQLSLLSS